MVSFQKLAIGKKVVGIRFQPPEMPDLAHKRQTYSR